MMKRYPDSLFSSKDEIENRSLYAWIKAHTTFLKPLHHHEGEIKIANKTITFIEDGTLFLEIPLDRIDLISKGFDNTFRRLEDRQIGLFDFSPVKIDYFDNNNEPQVIYLFASFRNRFGIIRSSKNTEFVEFVRSKLTEPSDS